MSRFIDLTGETFGEWTVLYRAPNIKPNRTRWFCLCSCGNEVSVLASNLTLGYSKRCRECGDHSSGNERSTHGHSKRLSCSREYISWSLMKARCLNPSSPSYPDYGGRGISVCQSWRDRFEPFLTDMGPRPEGTSLERLDVNGNYEPSNCKWATPTEQARNTRRNLIKTTHLPELLALRAAGHSLTVIAKRFGVSATHISRILNNRVPHLKVAC